METSRAKHDAPPPVYLEKGGGVGQGLRCGHQQGRPRGPARLSRTLTQPACLYKGGAPPGARGPEIGDPETPGAEAGEPGQSAERDPRPCQRRLDSRTQHGWPLGSARLARAGARGPRPRPASLQPAPPAHPLARRTDQARRLPPRRSQREPDSARGLPGVLPAPSAPRPPPPAGAPHLPRAPRSHRPLAAPSPPPPPPPAPGPSPPLRLPPQPASPAPGSASQSRPLGASASGQALTG